MIASNELPAKCKECAKSEAPRLHEKCHFCRDLEFQESVLCDLNRCIQDMTDFQCHGFVPILKLVSPSQNKATGQLDRPAIHLKKESYLKLFHSDKIKYERALALQKLGRDPDGVYVQLKYHFAWNVTHRIPVFTHAKNFIDFVNDCFLRCSELAGGFVELLYLAPDHVHLYVESDGELPIDEIAQKIKKNSNKAILEEFPFVKEKLVGNIEIWDEAYFVETVG